MSDFFPTFFHEVRNCPTITNVINVAAKRGYLPFFVLLFISHTRNSYATSVPSTRLSYVAFILEFRHGRSFVRRIQPGRGIILSIYRSRINFQLYPKVANDVISLTMKCHKRSGKRATSFYKRNIYIYIQNADASDGSRVTRRASAVTRNMRKRWLLQTGFSQQLRPIFLLFIIR